VCKRQVSNTKHYKLDTTLALIIYEYCLSDWLKRSSFHRFMQSFNIDACYGILIFNLQTCTDEFLHTYTLQAVYSLIAYTLVQLQCTVFSSNVDSNFLWSKNFQVPGQILKLDQKMRWKYWTEPWSACVYSICYIYSYWEEWREYVCLVSDWLTCGYLYIISVIVKK
jgi:hypothetical protein